MKKAFIHFFVISVLNPLNAYGFFFLEGGLGIGFGSTKTTEFASPNNYVHDAFNLGYSVDARAGFKLFLFDIGVTGSYGKTPTKFTREDPNASIVNEVRYDVSFAHTLYGAHLGVNIPVLPLKLFAEYYPSVQAEVTSSESKSENIFSEGQKFKGSGLGGGIKYQIIPFLGVHVLYRVFDLNELGSGKLPNAEQDDMRMEMVYAGVNLSL